MYQDDYHPNPDFQNENLHLNNVSDTSNVSNSNQPIMSDTNNTTSTTTPASQGTSVDQANQVAQATLTPTDPIKTKKQPLIVQAVQSRKGLYSRIKSALMRQISQNIDEGKSANLAMDKFIFDLIEEGLRRG